MIETEQYAVSALPLAAASARLGISSDALRMRIKRGKIRGFKRGGRVFVDLSEHPNEAQRTATERHPTGRFETKRTEDRAPGPVPEPSLPLVVEFQKVELSRLLRDNARLNQRFDRLMEELSHLREMQQREQVLRQQDQSLRQQIQDLLGRLTPDGPALESPAAMANSPEAPAPETPPEAPAPETPPEAPAPETPEPVAEAPNEEVAPLSESPDSYAYAPEVADGGAGAETAELAELLEDIGTSLRDLELSNSDAVPAEPPSPASAPTPAAPVPTPTPVEGARRVPDGPAKPAGDNEASLLEILGRMGPSAEDRRSAARLMKRLLRGRGAGRRREPGRDPG